MSAPPPKKPRSAKPTAASATAAPPEAATGGPDNEPARERTQAEKRVERRSKIAHELLDTEQTYVSSLVALVEVYIKPLRFNAQTSPNPIANGEAIGVIFNNIELIAKTNETLAESLAERMSEWDPHTTCVGDVLKRIAPFLKLYKQYSVGFSASLEMVARCSQSQQFAAFLEAGQRHPDSLGLFMADALIMPIQRIPRYLMLLTDLIKYTDDDHPDRGALGEALESISAIAHDVNASIVAAESLNRIVELQQMLSNDCPILVEPARRFIREGVLVKNREKRVYLLFSDVLVYAARTSSTSLQYKGIIDLDTTWVRDLPADEAPAEHSFQIVASRKTYTVTAESAEVKAEWMADLNAQIDALVAKDPTLVSRRAEAGAVNKSRFRRKGGNASERADGTPGASGGGGGGGKPQLVTPSAIALELSTPKLSYRYLFSGNCDKVGTLCKLGSSRFTRWNNRIFVLKDMFLAYYKSEADEEPTGVVPLEGCVVETRPDISKKSKFYFDLSHKTRTRVYHIYATDGAARTEWSNLLLRAINGDMAVSKFGLPFIVCHIAWGSLIVKELALKAVISVLATPESEMEEEHRSVLAAGDGVSLLGPLALTLNADGPVFELGLVALRHFSRYPFTHAFLAAPENFILDYLCGVMSRAGSSKTAVGNAAWTVVHVLAPQVGPGPDDRPPAAVDESPLTPLVLLLENAGDEFVIDATVKALEYLAQDAFLRPSFLKYKALKPLVETLRTSTSPTALYYGCLALSEVSSNDSIRAAIPNLGAIPTLVLHLSSSSPYVVEAAIRALTGLATSSHNRVLMTESLFLSPLLAALESNGTPDMQAVAMDCIRAFSASVYGKEVILDGGCFPALVAALTSHSLAVLTSVVAAIANVTEGGADLIQSEFRELGGIDAIAAVARQWLPAPPSRDHTRLQEAILRTLSNVCSTSDENIGLLVAEPETMAAVVLALGSPAERVVAQAARLAGEVSEVDAGARTLQHAAAVAPLFAVACWDVEGATTHQASARISAVLALANLAKSSIVVASLKELSAGRTLSLSDLAFGPGASGVAARKLGAKLDLDFGSAPTVTADTTRPAGDETVAQSGGRLTYAAPSKTPDASKAGTVIDSAVALESWMATTESELNVATGDVIAVYDASSPEWWFGRIGDTSGYVPSFCLETVEAGLRKTTSATLDKAVLVARISSSTDDVASMAMEDEGVRMGYLKLQSTSVLKSWVKHFAVLEGGKFSVYKSVHDPEPVFELDVQVANVKTASDLTFEMIAPSKRYLLQGESVQSTAEWVAAIRDATASQLRNVTSGKSGTLKRTYTKSKKQINDLISQIWALPGNATCADCFNAKPDWCSINLGVVFCIECSGLHRSLGTSISKVRSLKLDDLVPYVEEFMRAVGNDAANSIYEAWASRVIRYKPSDPSLAGMRAQYVKYKYAERRLLDKATEKDPDKLGAALRAAVESGSHMGILAALAAGASMTWTAAPGDPGILALAFAAAAPRVVFTALVLNNAPLNVVDESCGDAPVHAAVRSGRIDVLEILVDNNADLDVPDAAGLTAEQLAEELGNAHALATIRGEPFTPAAPAPVAVDDNDGAPPPPTDDPASMRIMSISSLPAPPPGTDENYEDLLALIDDGDIPPPPEAFEPVAPSRPPGPSSKRGSGPPPRLSQAGAPRSDEPGAAIGARRPTAVKLAPPAVASGGKRKPPPRKQKSAAVRRASMSLNQNPVAQPTKPSSPKPAKPAAAKPTSSAPPPADASSPPSKPASDKPSKPAAAKPSKPAAAKPSKPASNKPSKPASAKPSSPRTSAPPPSKPASNKPAKPASNKPASSAPPPADTSSPPADASSPPSKPAAAKPSKPAAAKPSKPAAAKPSKPASAKPSTSAPPPSDSPSSAPPPSKPASAKPAKPASTKPAKPASTKPTKPASAKPSKPSSTKPAKPSSTKPAKPSSTKPAKPSSTKPAGEPAPTPAPEPEPELDALDDIMALMGDFEDF